MSHILRTVTLEHGVRIKIMHDEDAECPLEWEQSRGKTEQTPEVYFVDFARRSVLGEYHHFSEPEEVVPFAEANGYVVFPLYRYEHGNVAYSTGSFACPWDSGQTGFVLVKANAGPDPAAIAKGICETVTQWCNGSVYGYVVSTPDDNHAASCWGFYSDRYDFEDVVAEAMPDAKHFIARLQEEAARNAEYERPDLYGSATP